MDHYDYTLLKAATAEAVKEQAKELNDKLTEIIFHLKEIKGLLYKQTPTLPPITLPDLPPVTPTIPGWPYVTTCTNDTKSEDKKQVLNG